MLMDDKKTLASCALVNRTFNLHTIPILYRSVSLTTPLTFTRFANATYCVTERSSRIRHLDLSGFSTCGLQKSSATTQNVVTPEILVNILMATPGLEAFSVSETLESAITVEVLKTLLFNCRKIKALDFCGCSGKQFGIAMSELAEFMGRVKISLQFDEDGDDGEEVRYSFQKIAQPVLPQLQRLSLHECPVISEHTAIITMLAHAPNLTHLDLGGCSVSDMTLKFLTTETNVKHTLKHLLLAKCKNISSEAISNFVSQCHQLETLNIYGERDIVTAIGEYDLITILNSPCAKRLQTLDIGSSQVTPRVLLAIQQNCSTSLRNLGISKAQITSISHLSDFLMTMTHLRYIDLTSIPCFNAFNTYGFITNLGKEHQLHTIEMSESLLKKLTTANDWKIDENYGRRRYYFRSTHEPRPDHVHSRKLDVTDCGPERMSKIFQYYSFGK
ncbi:1592_t:CDS:1 [Acaulospora colombiana]|uniref:1592_t:CDS:1 n=1 Tax=Acaulospora colombiana TaxID=27376 RepID=A0ACA9MCJ1_9GLOM|nr:1592_t:CDS:1 [Acaulospora colombiana]